MLHDLLSIQPDLPAEPEQEDLFSSALSTIFPDDCQVQHGDATSRIIYHSTYGELEFRCADVEGEVERTKFAHYLWNAGILMGELVGGKRGLVAEERNKKIGFLNGREWWIDENEESTWSVNSETVLEVGAGLYGV